MGSSHSRYALVSRHPRLTTVMASPLRYRFAVCARSTNCRMNQKLTINVDLVPTILDLCGTPPIESDGHSLRPILTKNTPELPPFQDDGIIVEYYSKQRWVNPIRTLLTPDFKYNRYMSHVKFRYLAFRAKQIK